jgi:Fe-Mn family superoxide dismutase
MIQQMPLPFAQDAISPAISADAMRFHYDKHFVGYVTKANADVEGTALADVPLEAIIFAAMRAPI